MGENSVMGKQIWKYDQKEKIKLRHNKGHLWLPVRVILFIFVTWQCIIPLGLFICNFNE